jgi:hypothetical protein
MPTVKIDNRKVAVAARLARFAAAQNRPMQSCPYAGSDDESSALRRVWLSTYMRLRPPAAGTVSYGTDGKKVAAAATDTAGLDDAADAQQHQAAWEQAKTQILADWPALTQPMVDDLSDQAAETSSSGDLARLTTIAVSAGVVAGLVAALTPPFTRVAAEAAGQVLADGKAHGVTVRPPNDQGAVAAGQVAALTASLIAAAYGQAATRKAMQVARGSASGVRSAVAGTLTQMGGAASGLVADQVGAGLSAAQHGGRLAAFNAAGPGKVVGWRSVETLDQNTCVNCEHESGRTYRTLEEMEAAYPVAGLATCLGGTRCRGYARAIWK